ncbi:MAG: SGNH/GDSL hydrolase family protein [Planctomycetota bacterium]|jgi:lysophospholipase L1-like esterase
MKPRGRLGRRLVLVVVLLGLLEGALQLAAPIVRGAMDRGDVAPSPDASLTVLCVGDSNTFGLNVPRHYSYPGRLRALLEARFRAPVTVHNRGVPGQNGAQVAASIERDLLETDPDIVLILVGINDTWNRDAEDGGSDSWLGRLKLVRLVRVLVAGVTTAGRFEVTTDEQGRIVVDRGEGARPVNAGEGAVGVRSDGALTASVQRAVERIVVRCREDGARVALMTYAETGGDFTTVNAALRETARALDLPLVDHERAFQDHVAALGYEAVMMNDHHPNARGYGLMAHAVVDELERAQWIPGAEQVAPLPRPPRTSTADVPPSVRAEGNGRLRLSGPAEAPFQLLVARSPEPDDGFAVQGHRIPLPDDEVLALSRLEPAFSGRLDAFGQTAVRVPERLHETAGASLSACLVVLGESPDGPTVAAVSPAVEVRF